MAGTVNVSVAPSEEFSERISARPLLSAEANSTVLPVAVMPVPWIVTTVPACPDDGDRYEIDAMVPGPDVVIVFWIEFGALLEAGTDVVPLISGSATLIALPRKL